MMLVCILRFLIAAFNDFCYIFLILSLFLSCSRLFDTSVNSSGLFLWYVKTYAKSCSLSYFLSL